MQKTRITKGAAAGHSGWARRAIAHPQIVAALADRQMSQSYGRTICTWTDQLPENCRHAADAILLGAAKAGMDLQGLAALAAEIRDRSHAGEPDDPGSGSRTGRCGWKRPSTEPASCTVT
jgi:hypothetical protein